MILPTTIEGRPQKNAQKPQQKHVNMKHKTRAKKESKEVFIDSEKAEDLLKHV